MVAQVGIAGLEVTGGSYGWFLWFLWLFGLRMAAQVGVTDRMSVHVLDEEQLAPLRVR